MFAAILLDQRGSRRNQDLVAQRQEQLNNDQTLRFVLPFERTAGDEMEGLTQDPATVAELALRGLQSADWWVGIGIGDVDEPLPESVRSSHGTAFVLARRAIDDAKERPATGRIHPVRVAALHRDPVYLEAALGLMSVLFSRSSTKQSEAARLRSSGLNIVQIAERLAVTKQAVSKQLLAAHWNEEQAGRRLVEYLAGELLR